jgi:hypothetical protein
MGLCFCPKDSLTFEDLAQGLADLQAIRACGHKLTSSVWIRAVNFQCHAQIYSLAGIHNLIAKARTNNQWGSMCQGLHETILAAMSEENVHTYLEKLNLGQAWCTENIRWHHQRPKRIRLWAKGHDNQRRSTVLNLRAKGVEYTSPSGLTELSASDTTWLTICATRARFPAQSFQVPSDHSAHTH